MEVTFKGLEHVFHISKTLVEFQIFGMQISIKWYGFLIAFGFLLAVLFGGRIAYKWKMNLDKMIDVLIWGTVFGILGARLYYVIFHLEEYHSLGEALRIWEGGLAIYGGLIGGLGAAIVVCRVNGLNLLNLLDIAGMSFLIGQGIGRWGNFTNQEAFGTNTNLPWGMKSNATMEYLFAQQQSLSERGMSVDPGGYVHPTFLYEFLWCILGFFVLYWIMRRHRRFSGQIILCYAIWYGAGRTVIEGLRTDSLYLWNTNLRVSQVLSILLVLGCSALLSVLMVKNKRHPKPIEGVDFFPQDEKSLLKKSKQTKSLQAEIQTQAEEELTEHLKQAEQTLSGTDAQEKTEEEKQHDE